MCNHDNIYTLERNRPWFHLKLATINYRFSNILYKYVAIGKCSVNSLQITYSFIN